MNCPECGSDEVEIVDQDEVYDYCICSDCDSEFEVHEDEEQ